MLIYCAKCEAANSDEAPVCGECGHPLAGPADRETLQPLCEPHETILINIPLIAENLTRCKDCGELVSDLAETCPHCGRPNPTVPHGVVALGQVAFAVLVLIGLYFFLSWLGFFSDLFDGIFSLPQYEFTPGPNSRYRD